MIQDKKVARYTYDTEFIDDGSTIELISIGIVCLDDDREYYAVNREVSLDRIHRHRWLNRNVLSHLPVRQHCAQCGHLVFDETSPQVKPRRVIADEVHAFLTADGLDPMDNKVRELWAYYAAFDHVVLTQLWGPLSEAPPGIPWFTRDIKDWAVRVGDPLLPQPLASEEHDALQDARHNRTVIRWLRQYDLDVTRSW